MDIIKTKIAVLLELGENESIFAVVLGYIGVLLSLFGLLVAAYTTIGYEAIELFFLFLFCVGFLVAIALAIDNKKKKISK